MYCSNFFNSIFVMIKFLLIISVLLFVLQQTSSCKCYKSYEEQFGEKVEEKILSVRPHEYIKSDSLPTAWDWRNVNGVNYASHVLSQQTPAVCGSCWIEAATGSLTDRYNIATKNKLNVQLSVQHLLNFNAKTVGGTCNGGDDLKAYEFIYKNSIVDETCAPFLGVNSPHGFVVSGYTTKEDIQANSCSICDWSGTCGFVPR